MAVYDGEVDALASAIVESALRISDGSRPVSEEDSVLIAKQLLYYVTAWQEYVK